MYKHKKNKYKLINCQIEFERDEISIDTVSSKIFHNFSLYVIMVEWTTLHFDNMQLLGSLQFLMF